MKKWNLFFLFGAILLFIVIMIPYFQNAVQNAQVIFFGARITFTTSYMWIVFFGAILGVLVLLYLQSVFNSVRTKTPEKFDLN